MPEPQAVSYLASAFFTPDSFQAEFPEEDSILENEWTYSWREAFAEDRYQALYDLGTQEKPEQVSAGFLWLYRLSCAFFTALTSQPGLEVSREQTVVLPDEELSERLLYSMPFCIGAEYVNTEWIENIFRKLNEVFCRQIAEYPGTVALFFAELDTDVHIPERIFFHLVENEKESAYPFAFIATYTTRDEAGRVCHKPLSYALTEYKQSREKLMNLLSCLGQAADASPLIAGFMTSGELFHSLRLTAQEAFAFLKAVPEIEKGGILCRVPNWWRRNYSSVGISVNLGDGNPEKIGFDELITMQPSLVVNGVRLTREDVENLLAQTEGLANLKGKWIEVDHDKLRRLLDDMQKYEGKVTLLEALRMQAGLEKAAKQEDWEGILISNGKWLGSLVQKLRSPGNIAQTFVPEEVHAQLRPYQQLGFNWLHYMSELGFGACLADDMGLGKTLQVLTYLMKLYEEKPEAKVLLVVPASLIGNWAKESQKFTPSLPFVILHGMTSSALNQQALATRAFLYITTYGMASRILALQEMEWEALILDEAQAIKNPATQQTRTIKKLKAAHKIAMTGTPIENELGNLWSLFDFLNKGLLGSSKEFRDFTKKLDQNTDGYARLKGMVSPFILRRLKTDKSIIADLPEKMEQIDYVSMSKKQVVLYRKVVSEMAAILSEVDGMQRRGMVLATITKLKQICNHPDQYLGQEKYSPEESGKFAMLYQICETIHEKHEKVLVFTQYTEIIPHLEKYLESIFGRKGLSLHGGVEVSRRQKMVDAFQSKEEYVPFMILSVRAGGTGLNLTAANHVIHFDRWWNPAVENQATDRAFRIGQDKNVMVHKLVSEGTIEEKIDAIINSKKALAENVIGGTSENWITEMSNDELLNLMRLDG